MSARQMWRRCPGARAYGVGRLDGWRFQITAGAGANIVRAPGACVYGVVWRVEARHLAQLDRWEGVAARRYRRKRLGVEVAGVIRPMVAYVSERHHAGVGKVNYMLSAVLPGARAFALPPAFIAELSSWVPVRPIGERVRAYRGRRSGGSREVRRAKGRRPTL